MQQNEAKRAKKLLGLLERLKQGKNVQNRDLLTWLGADGYAQYEADWASQKDLRGDLANKPVEISRYEALLKKAQFSYNKAEGYSRTGKFRASELEYRQSDTEFEGLLEYLDEIVAANQSLRVWFDREIDRANFSLTPDAVPIVVTSKSALNEAKGGGILREKQSKHQVKIDAVERALSEIEQNAQGVNTGALVALRKARAVNIHAERESD